jgi:hypothetical protein
MDNMNTIEDQKTFDESIEYFRKLTNSNVKTYAKHKMAATFIGIKTNISGTNRLHIYILLFPFCNHEEYILPYSSGYKQQNLYLKDIYFCVDTSFYTWVYDELKRLNNIIMMELSLTDYSLKSINNDALIRINSLKEKESLITTEFEEWYEKGVFNTSFVIEITHPYLYLVPFPVKNIVFKTSWQSNFLTPLVGE